MKDYFNRNALGIAFVLALLGTLGSLYFSEIRGLEACPLCWYQRIALFPQVVILGVAFFREGKQYTQAALMGFILSVFGVIIGIYQYVLQRVETTGLAEICTIDSAVDCTAIQFELFGFVTIPFLSALLFVILAFLLGWVYRYHTNSTHTPV